MGNDISIQELGKYWVKGYDFEWAEYFNKENNSLVSLPAYPFEKERYWIEKKETLIQKEKSKKTI